jgi:hypothetical protein
VQCSLYHGCGRVVSQMILAASSASDGDGDGGGKVDNLRSSPRCSVSTRETTENHSVPSPSTTTTSIAIEFRLRSRFRSTVYDTIDEVQKWSWAA